jgi:hypothetical protein
MSDDAPKRIWANTAVWGDGMPLAGEWNHCDVGLKDDAPYILATPDALAEAPEVQALIAAAILDAQLRVMERGRIDTPDEIRAAAIRAGKE